MRRGVTPFLGEPFRPGELAANRCRPGQFRQQLAFPDRGCWIAGDNSPCVELTRTAQAPRAAFLFARLSSGPRPCRWCGRTRPESPRTQPESCRLPAAFSALRAPSGPTSPAGRPSCLISEAGPCWGPWPWRHHQCGPSQRRSSALRSCVQATPNGREPDADEVFKAGGQIAEPWLQLRVHV